MKRCSSERVYLGIPIPIFDFIEDKESKSEINIKNFFPSRQEPKLPVVDYNSPIFKIYPHVLAKILDDPLSNGYSNILIIDVRFPYEYNGGHIKGAKNITSFEQLHDLFLQNRGSNVCVVFHCEYSQERGPEFASEFRNFDRKFNFEEQNRISYPETYILYGGYNEFYSKYLRLCNGGYIKMDDSYYQNNGDYKKYNHKFHEQIRCKLRASSMHYSQYSKSQNIRNSYLTSTNTISTPFTQSY